MKFRFREGKDPSILDLDRQKLESMSPDQLALLEGCDYNDDLTLREILIGKTIYKVFQLYKFYAEDDKLNDPTGSEHEYYLDRYTDREITEDMMKQLVKYNHQNVDVFNEAVMIKYNNNGKKLSTATRSTWPEYWPARCVVVYGEPQDQVYNKMVAAFGKDVIDPLWKRYQDKE